MYLPRYLLRYITPFVSLSLLSTVKFFKHFCQIFQHFVEFYDKEYQVGLEYSL